jgi:hypothetical protein
MVVSWITGVHRHAFPPQVQHLWRVSPKEREKFTQDNDMCLICQDCKRGTDRKPACQSLSAQEATKCSHELMTKGAASVNATCCIKTEEEDEG